MAENVGGNQNTCRLYNIRAHTTCVETCGMRKNKVFMKDMCHVTSFWPKHNDLL